MTEIAVKLQAYFPDKSQSANIYAAINDLKQKSTTVNTVIKQRKITKTQAQTFASYTDNMEAFTREEDRIHCDLLGGSDFDECRFIKTLAKVGAKFIVSLRDFDGGTQVDRELYIDGKKAKLAAFIDAIANIDPELALFLSIEQNSIQQVGLLLKKGVNPNITYHGKTALCLAYSRNSKIADLLLKCGADPNLPNTDNERQCPIHCCASLYYDLPGSNLLAALIEYGAKVNAEDAQGMSPLLYAAKGAKLRMCEVLVEHGAEINHVDALGKSALHYAADHSGDALDTINFLINEGNEATQKDHRGNSALFYACGKRYIESRLLEEGLQYDELNVDYTEDDPKKQLYEAIYYNQIDRVAELINSDGSLLKEVIGYGRLTPLCLAAYHGRNKILEFLVAAGGNPLGGEQCVPVEEASFQGYVDIIEYLLELGARVDQPDKGGAKSLLKALRGRRNDCARFLIAHGALNCARHDVKALIEAIDYADVDVVEQICSVSEVLDYKENSLSGVYYPINGALMRRGEPKVLQVVLSAGAILPDDFVPDFIESKMTQGDVDEDIIVAMLEVATDFGAKLDAMTRLGETALTLAAMHNKIKILNFLIEHGVSVNITNVSGRTALSCAAGRGYLECVQYLIGKGADVTLKDRRGFLPYSYAKSKKHLEIMDLVKVES